MLSMTCTQILKNDKGEVIGYTLKNIANQKENYSTGKLYELIKYGEIEVDNLVFDKSKRVFVFNIKKEDNKLKSFLNKATIMGLETKEIKVTKDKKIYYVKQAEDLHTIYIPDGVDKLYDNDVAASFQLTRVLNTIQGVVKFTGGKDLTDTRGVFSSCESNLTIDLTKLKLDFVKDMSMMFYCCKVNKVIFGDVYASELENINKIFDCATIKEIDMSKFRANTILNFREAFMNCDSIKIDIRGLKGNRAKMVLGKEAFHYMFFNYNEGQFGRGIQEIIINCPYILDKYNNREKRY